MIQPDLIDGGFVAEPIGDIASVVLDGETVLYDERFGSVYVLNSTATLIWQGLDGRLSVDERVADLAAVFAVAADDIRTDVIEAVRDFGRQGLLIGVEADAQVVAANVLVPPDEGGTQP